MPGLAATRPSCGRPPWPAGSVRWSISDFYVTSIVSPPDDTTPLAMPVSSPRADTSSDMIWQQPERDVPMGASTKATRIDFFNFATPPMRAFHLSWFAFFLCFFAWFGIAPLMTIVREELQLTKSQIGWCIIGSVSITIVARFVTGWLCDRFGPRWTYTGVLVLGSLPVFGMVFAHDFATFLL